MDADKLASTQHKYRLPYHWMRDELDRDSLSYFGYISLSLTLLPEPPARILEAGCGDGRMTAELVKAGYSVTGLELLENQVRFASTLVPEATVLQSDLRQPLDTQHGLERSSFDAATLIEVYEHIPPDDAAKVLANIMPMLKPGARLIVSVPTHELPMSKLHYRHFDRETISSELRSAGYEIQSVTAQDRLSGPWRWIMGRRMNKLLNGSVIQSPALKKLRRWVYRRCLNEAPLDRRAGRYIVCATRPC